MVSKIVVGFEGNTISVIEGAGTGENVLIKRNLTFPAAELGNFLQKEKSKEFTVVSDFEIFFSEVLHIPFVKGKYFTNILQAQIRKSSTELKEFSYLHSVLGERIVAGKKKQEVFVFAVDNSEIYKILDKFTLHGKRVTQLIPDIFALAQTVWNSKEPVLCVTKSGINKYLFLIKEGKIYFIRSAKGIDSGLHDFDVGNINMAVNYCRQLLKIDPTQVILIGSACFEYDAKAPPIIPMVCLDFRPRVLASKETIVNFMKPILCLQAGKYRKTFLAQSDILPVKYKVLNYTRTALTYAAYLFALLFTLGSAYAGLNVMKMLELKGNVEAARARIKNIHSVKSVYENRKAELQKLTPLINFINKMNSGTNYQNLLFDLTKFTLTNIKINNMLITNKEKEGLNFTINGFVSGEGFTQTHRAFQNFVDSVERVKDIQVVSKKLELQDKTFGVTAKYSSKKIIN